MELNCKLNIKYALRDEVLAQGLRKGSTTFEESLKDLAIKTNLKKEFLEMNIDRIRNWIA